MQLGDFIMVLFTFGGGFLILRPIGAAIARRIGGEAGRPGVDPAEHEAVVAELAELRQQVTALGERMDFAERMLARGREAPRVAPGPRQ